MTEQQQLVNRINKYYKAGDTIKVRMADGSVKDCTVNGDAYLLFGNTAVISIDEMTNVTADRVVFKRSNTAING
jgi:hypothetical protein